MNTRLIKRAAVLALLGMLGGCAATVRDTHSNPILSAEQAQAMIRVEVTTLEPLPVDQALADLQ